MCPATVSYTHLDVYKRQAGFREVEVIFAAQHAFQTDGVREGERGGVQRHGNTALLGVDKRFAGGVAQGHSEFGGGDRLLEARVLEFIGYCLVPDLDGRVIFLLQGYSGAGKSLI